MAHWRDSQEANSRYLSELKSKNSARVALGDAELQSYIGKKAIVGVAGYPCGWNESLQGVVCTPLKFDFSGYYFDLL
jgi:hypothetical protein